VIFRDEAEVYEDTCYEQIWLSRFRNEEGFMKIYGYLGSERKKGL
jgi:hypothetical protein